LQERLLLSDSLRSHRTQLLLELPQRRKIAHSREETKPEAEAPGPLGQVLENGRVLAGELGKELMPEDSTGENVRMGVRKREREREREEGEERKMKE
jgi:hypothetical protein